MSDTGLQKEINEYKNNFYKIYNEKLLPIFKEFEPKRKKQLLKLWLVLIPCLCIIVTGLFLLLFSGSDSSLNDFIGISILFVILVAVCVPSFMCYSFVCDIKSECLKSILPTFESISRKEASFITEAELIQSELFDTNSSISCDDSLCGTYRDVNFKVSELTLFGDAAKTNFKGVVLSFKFNKAIKNKTVITSKFDKSLRKNSKPYFWEILFIIIFLLLTWITFSAAFAEYIEFPIRIFFIGLGIFSLFFIYACFTGIIEKHKNNSSILKLEKLKQIKLEDIEFNKKYLAYSSDEVEGRYLITPAFMERLKNMQTTFGSKKIKCSFYEDSLMFAISTRKNVFEIGNLFRPLTDPKTMENFFNEIISIYLMIDYFKLDENTKL